MKYAAATAAKPFKMSNNNVAAASGLLPVRRTLVAPNVAGSEGAYVAKPCHFGQQETERN